MLINTPSQLIKIIKIIIFLLAFVPYVVLGQKSKTRILFNSADINKVATDTLNIKRIRSSFWTDTVVVHLKGNRKLKLAPEKVWGYKDKDQTVYRYYNGEFIEVRQIDDIIVYRKVRGAKPRTTTFYISKTLDSEMLKLNSKNIKKLFADNPCFLNKIENEFKWYQDYSSFDKTNGTYKLVEYLKACKGK
jgi:hypothetical protein